MNKMVKHNEYHKKGWKAYEWNMVCFSTEFYIKVKYMWMQWRIKKHPVSTKVVHEK